MHNDIIAFAVAAEKALRGLFGVESVDNHTLNRRWARLEHKMATASDYDSKTTIRLVELIERFDEARNTAELHSWVGKTYIALTDLQRECDLPVSEFPLRSQLMSSSESNGEDDRYRQNYQAYLNGDRHRPQRKHYRLNYASAEAIRNELEALQTTV